MKISKKKNIYDQQTLHNLVNDKYGCVELKKCEKRITLGAAYSNDMKTGILETLNKGLKKFDPRLNGIVLGYEKTQVIYDTNSCKIIGRFGEFDLGIAAQMFLFQPKVGSLLEGTVNVKSYNHIGCLVHKYFNARILRPECVDYSEWNCKNINIDDKIIFEVTDLDFSRRVPYIEGKITNRCISASSLLDTSEVEGESNDHGNSLSHPSPPDRGLNKSAEKSLCEDTVQKSKKKAMTNKKSDNSENDPGSWNDEQDTFDLTQKEKKNLKSKSLDSDKKKKKKKDAVEKDETEEVKNDKSKNKNLKWKDGNVSISSWLSAGDGSVQKADKSNDDSIRDDSNVSLAATKKKQKQIKPKTDDQLTADDVDHSQNLQKELQKKNKKTSKDATNQILKSKEIQFRASWPPAGSSHTETTRRPPHPEGSGVDERSFLSEKINVLSPTASKTSHSPSLLDLLPSKGKPGKLSSPAAATHNAVPVVTGDGIDDQPESPVGRVKKQKRILAPKSAKKKRLSEPATLSRSLDHYQLSNASGLGTEIKSDLGRAKGEEAVPSKDSSMISVHGGSSKKDIRKKKKGKLPERDATSSERNVSAASPVHNSLKNVTSPRTDIAHNIRITSDTAEKHKRKGSASPRKPDGEHSQSSPNKKSRIDETAKYGKSLFSDSESNADASPVKVNPNAEGLYKYMKVLSKVPSKPTVEPKNEEVKTKLKKRLSSSAEKKKKKKSQDSLTSKQSPGVNRKWDATEVNDPFRQVNESGNDSHMGRTVLSPIMNPKSETSDAKTKSSTLSFVDGEFASMNSGVVQTGKPKGKQSAKKVTPKAERSKVPSQRKHDAPSGEDSVRRELNTKESCAVGSPTHMSTPKSENKSSLNSERKKGKRRNDSAGKMREGTEAEGDRTKDYESEHDSLVNSLLSDMKKSLLMGRSINDSMKSLTNRGESEKSSSSKQKASTGKKNKSSLTRDKNQSNDEYSFS